MRCKIIVSRNIEGFCGDSELSCLAWQQAMRLIGSYRLAWINHCLWASQGKERRSRMSMDPGLRYRGIEETILGRMDAEGIATCPVVIDYVVEKLGVGMRRGCRD